MKAWLGCLLISVFGLAASAENQVAQALAPDSPSTASQKIGNPPPVPPANQPPPVGEAAPTIKQDEKPLKPETEKALEPLEKDQAAQSPSALAPSKDQKSRIGLHVALGIPHPTTVGLDYLSTTHMFGFSLIGGSTEGTVDGYDVTVSNFELQFRYHPWQTAFFFGLAGGNHVVKVSQTQTFMGQSVKGEATVNAGYMTPQIGWLRTWDSGFTLGFELGWLIPTSTSTQFTSNAPSIVQSTSDYQQFESDVKDQGDQIGRTGVPYVTLLRVGWLF